MTLPANIRINMSAPFPSQVKGSGPVTVSKQNGIWSIGLGVGQLGPVVAGFDPTTIDIPVYNTINQTWQVLTVQQMLSGGNVQRLVTAAGNIVVQGNDRIILVKQLVPAAASIILPAAGTRNGVPITVKDLAGVAAGNPLTFVPNGAETIDGAASAVINDNFEAMTLYPIVALGGPAGWWIG